jgi:hypothetical protein
VKPAASTPGDREAIRSRLEELERATAGDFESVEAPAALIELYARDRDWPDLVRRAELIGADVAGRRGDIATQGRVDMVLRHLGSALAGAVSGVECAARLGGEEFVLLLPGTGAEAAAVRCGNLTGRIRAMDWSEMTGAHPVTASIGVATYADGRMTAGDLLAAADENLYAAKRSGRDRVVAGIAG